MTQSQTKTLKQLFADEQRVVIPDLQRDYCWGDAVHTAENKELVSGFVDNLIEQFKNRGSSSLTLGLIYGYEGPKGHFHLCDGQQRITTLFLLLGMLNRGKANNAFRALLRDEQNGTPYLQYAIRETSLYFLSDLVRTFFLKEGDAVSSVAKIEKAPWFFADYRTDPSIQSMLRALLVMEAKLKEHEDMCCEGFGRFLTTQLQFLYVDLGTRANGEKTYVVINTTGEPLTATENLKPLVCGAEINQDNSNVAKDWEEVETWFWKKRKGDNDTADAGWHEFLRWVTLLHENDKVSDDDKKRILSKGKFAFPYEKIAFEHIYATWATIKFLFERWEGKDCLKDDPYNKRWWLSPNENAKMKGRKCISQIDAFFLLPLIAYCQAHNISDATDRNLWRWAQWLRNLARIDRVEKSVNDHVLDVVRLARSCRDVIDLLTVNDVSKTLLSDEERRKLEILRDDAPQREAIEAAFWQAQTRDVPCHKIWSGEILPLIEWATIDGQFVLELFKSYSKVFDSVFVGECDGNIDLVRRALLTRELENYPYQSGSNLCYGWEWKDWQKLINKNRDNFKAFFDELLSVSQTSEGRKEKLQAMIDAFPKDRKRSPFVHEEGLLAFCKEKNIRYFDDAWYLISKARMTSRVAHVEAYRYFLYRENKPWPERCKKLWFWHERPTCVVFEVEEKDNKIPPFGFDLFWIKREERDCVELRFALRLYQLAETEKEWAKDCIEALAKGLNFTWVPAIERFCKWIDVPSDVEQLYKELDAACKEVFDAVAEL